MAYTKINWKNLPSTNTPVNATNLNHMDEGIYDANDKNIITAQISSDFTISTTDTATDIKTFTQYAKVGSKLSVSNGCIKIGSGVSKVKVSYNAVVQNTTSTATSRAFTYLMQNTTTVTQESIYFNRTWEQISVAHNEIIRSVAENDIFYLRTYGLKDIKFLSGGSYFCDTAITVEVIE